MSPTPRIGYVLLEWPRYSETFILNEMLALAPHGFPAHVFCLRGAPGESPAAGTPFAARTENIGSFDGEVELPLSAVAEAAEERPEAVEHIAASVWARLRSRAEEADIARRREPLFAMACAFQIARRCRELEIAHLHCHYAGLPAEVGALVRRLTAIPYSFTGHAKDIFTMNPDRLRRRIESAAFAVTCSETGRRTMADAAPACADRIHLVYHGIETGNWNIARRPVSPPFQIVSVGRLTPKKGFPVLIEALALLRARGQDVHVTIIGEGRERERLEGLARALGVSDRLCLPGRLDQNRIREAFSTAAAFVLPSIVLESKNQDGVANAVLEALASALPVVVSDIPALTEVVEHGTTGLLFSSGSATALADALQRLLGDRELAGRLATAGRERAAQLDLSAAAQSLAELFCAHA